MRRAEKKDIGKEVHSDIGGKEYPIQKIFFIIMEGFLVSSIWTLLSYMIGMKNLHSLQFTVMVILLIGSILVLYGYFLWLKNKQLKIWEKRNRIYLSLNEDLSDWVTYKDITREELKLFLEYLNKQIEVITRIKDSFFIYIDNPPF